jgi:hypothetical protein
LHVVLNTVAALACAAAIVWPTGDVAGCSATSRWPGCRSWRLTALAGWLWYVMLR